MTTRAKFNKSTHKLSAVLEGMDLGYYVRVPSRDGVAQLVDSTSNDKSGIGIVGDDYVADMPARSVSRNYVVIKPEEAQKLDNKELLFLRDKMGTVPYVINAAYDCNSLVVSEEEIKADDRSFVATARTKGLLFDAGPTKLMEKPNAFDRSVAKIAQTTADFVESGNVAKAFGVAAIGAVVGFMATNPLVSSLANIVGVTAIAVPVVSYAAHSFMDDYLQGAIVDVNSEKGRTPTDMFLNKLRNIETGLERRHAAAVGTTAPTVNVPLTLHA